MAHVASNIAKNMKQLREARNFSQEQLAKLSGIPRPTWSNLESGDANPTVQVLLRVAMALQVSLDELVGSPREACQFFPAEKLAVRRRGDAFIRKLLPEGIPGVEFDRIELVPGSRMSGIPHRTGTREYLTCERGLIELAVTGERYRLNPGDVVVFRGDQKHSYANVGKDKAVGFSVVMLAPLSLDASTAQERRQSIANVLGAGLVSGSTDQMRGRKGERL